MSWVSRAGIVGQWVRHARMLRAMGMPLAKLGSDHGGMTMRFSGRSQKQDSHVIEWHLEARSNHGPEIPCTPATVVARRLLRGAETRVGALPCYGLVTLEELREDLSGFDIDWTFTEPEPDR